MPPVSYETPSTRWLSLCEFKGLIPRVTLRSPWALLCRAVGTDFRFISAFTDRLVLCALSDFFKSVFQFYSIFCSVLAQTVDEPFFCIFAGLCHKQLRLLYLKYRITHENPHFFCNICLTFYFVVVILFTVSLNCLLKRLFHE